MVTTRLWAGTGACVGMGDIRKVTNKRSGWVLECGVQVGIGDMDKYH